MRYRKCEREKREAFGRSNFGSIIENSIIGCPYLRVKEGLMEMIYMYIC